MHDPTSLAGLMHVYSALDIYMLPSLLSKLCPVSALHLSWKLHEGINDVILADYQSWKES